MSGGRAPCANVPALKRSAPATATKTPAARNRVRISISPLPLPSNRLTILAMVRSGPVHAVHGVILGDAAPIEDGLGHRRIACEEDSLVSADRGAGHGTDVMPFGAQGAADELE